MIWHFLVEGPWIVFCIYWAVGALKTRRTVSPESFAARARFILLEIIGFALLFRGFVGFGALGIVFSLGATRLGYRVAFTWIGIALALWARWHLDSIGAAESPSRRITSSSAPGPTPVSGIRFIPGSFWR